MSGLSMPYVIALITAVVGCVLGLVVTYLLPKQAVVKSTGDSETDLEERLQHFISQLRDLEEQRQRLEPAEYATQKAEFEARAAHVLKLLKQPKEVRAKQAAKEAAEVTPAVAFLASRPQLRGALWGGGTVGVLALLYTLAVNEERPRPEGPMGQRPPMTGGDSVAAGGASDSREAKELVDALQKDPNDLPKLLRIGHLLLKDQMLKEAEVVTQRALQLAPNEKEALVHQAVITAGHGDTPKAIAQLDTVLKRDETFAEAWFFRGMLGMQSGNQELARESIAQFVRYAPDGPQKERFRQMLSNMNAQ